ncbi:MAG: hypothetical protein JKY94_16760 [Rhodobacteraceae bacterium]|nr:hypothetical protein [Paracoccaceae bacterium]
MPLTYAAIPTEEITRATNNGPLIVASNLLRSAIALSPFWNTGGLPGSTDLTDPTQTEERASDYALDLPFATLDTSNTTYYITFQISASEVDTVGVILQNLPGGRTYTITVEFATNATFTDRATVATWSGITNISRLIQSGLDYPEDSATAGVNRFTNITYGRVKIVQTAGTQGPPAIGEILIGRRQGLSHSIETGSDDVPRGAAYEDFVTAGRKIFRYVTASGYEDHRASYHFGGTAVSGATDLATLRTIQSECNSGAQAIWARWRTGSNWVLGYFRDPMDLPIGSGQYQERYWAFEFNEQAPFAASEV